MRVLSRLLLPLLLLAPQTLPAAGPGLGQIEHGGRAAVSLRSGLDQSALDLSGDGWLRLGLGAGFTLELGLLGLASDLGPDVDTPHETYGALGWQGGGLSLSFGVPRPAYDLAVLSPLERLAPALGLAADRMGQTRSRATWGAIYAGGLPQGLRLAGEGAGLRWAVSAHRMGEVSLAGAALAGSSGDTDFGAALEWASDGELAAKAGASRHIGAWAGGVAGYVAAAPGESGLAEAWLAWSASDRLTLTGLMQAPTGEGPSLAALAGEWQLGQAATARLTLASDGGQGSATLGLDWRF